MNKSIIIVCLLFGATQLMAQCAEEVDQIIINNYTQVANSVAWPASNGLFLDSTIVNDVLVGFNAIFNDQQLPEVDSVFNIYCIDSDFSIYSNPNPNTYHSYYIELDTSITWVHNWINGEDFTGNNNIDSVFQFIDYSIYPFNENYIIEVNNLINFNYLTEILNNESAVVDVNFWPNIGGDGNKIFYNKENDIQYFNFQLAWGDCPSGCQWYRTFSFSVDENCLVNYLGASGSDVMPFPVGAIAPQQNCNLFTSIPNFNVDFSYILNIKENPFKDELSFELKNTNLNNLQYELININGFVQKKGYVNHNNKIDTSNLPSGIYLLNIYNKSKAVTNIKLFKSP